MSNSEDAFLKELMMAFHAEATEHVGMIALGLWELEKKTAQTECASIMEGIYRDAHSLKGAARSVNNKEIEDICQSLEDVFAVSKKSGTPFEPDQFTALNHGVEAIRQILEGKGGKPEDRASVIKNLEAIIPGSVKEPHVPDSRAKIKTQSDDVPPIQPANEVANSVAELPMEPKAKNVVGMETIRIPVERLDSLLFQVEEMLIVKQSLVQRSETMREIEASFDQWKARWTASSTVLSSLSPRSGGAVPAASALPEEGVAELIVWHSERMKSMEDSLKSIAKQADEDQRVMGRMISELLEAVKKTVMLPASRVLQGYPKMIHDLCRSQGKEVDVQMDGTEIEMDKRILEEIKDPILHILRNCADHGLETPGERELAGKPPAGNILIKLSHPDSTHVQIVISDDGAGIDAATVKSAAVKAGTIAFDDAERLSDEEALSLIFQSAISTKAEVSELSGRGLGLAIVREKVQKLAGSVVVRTNPGKGTSFIIVLPLTLVTFRGILVQVSERSYVLPATDVERVMRVKAEDIKTVENRETIQFNGETVGLVRMNSVLELPPSSHKETSFFSVVVIKSGDWRLAFLVDRIMGEQEILVKKFGKQLARVRNIGGATVIASGEIIPILNVADLIQSSTSKSFHIGGTESAVTPLTAETAPAILLAEDSITSRMLLKNILQTAGYQVRTAVDGTDAWTILKTETFNAVVSDVDMPRMNGFDLTARIRADAKLADMPVILVTARETREDREHGIEVGANAYIIKSSFDQSNLLNILRRVSPANQKNSGVRIQESE